MFRLEDRKIADRIVEKLKKMELQITIMHVCGTHQDTLVRHGLDILLENVGVDVRQGPGCPVCVTTPAEIEEALWLARHGKTVAVFGDMARVPSKTGSLLQAKAEGCDVRVVYSIDDAIKLAEKGKEVVFIGIGFETTAPSTAAALMSAKNENFSVLSCHRTVPPALEALIKMGETKLQGLIEPGHVSTIIGIEPYKKLAAEFKIPQVIAGFEPLDLLMGVYLLAEMIKNGESDVKNEYSRVVRPEGNPRAREAMKEVFVTIDVKWRGFPVIPRSGLEIGERYAQFNARKKYEHILEEVHSQEFEEPEGCRCAEVLRGLCQPVECPFFGTACRPEHPVGPCMVSFEGGCAIEWNYRGRKGGNG
ncbi:MAG: hydrogenase formation protein HypD [Thermoplasmata archaeon]|nr:hydrogenase formation protein HypD [Thermoplasmata archaeon]